MNSKASYFSLSRALILENLRRLWPLPVVQFAAYFLAGVFPLMMMQADGRSGSGNWYLMDIFNNDNFVFMAVGLMAPISTGIAVFGYLQRSASATRMHSLPFSRARLFNSNFVSGLLMLWLPIIAIGLILSIFASGIIGASGMASAFVWIGENMLAVFFLFAVSAIAADIAGTTVHQLLLTVFLYFLVPVMYTLVQAYASEYLNGYRSLSLSITRFFSPWLYLAGSDHYTWAVFAYYVVLSLIALVLAFLLYTRRKLERTGDGLVYGFMNPIVSFVGAFWGMSLLGFFFEVVGDSSWKVAGYIIGAFLGFMIARMILFKTGKVFNKRFWAGLGIYALCAAVFFSALIFDLVGYAHRVPNNTVSASVDAGLYRGHYYNDRTQYDYVFGNNTVFMFTEPANIEEVKALHKELIDADSELYKGNTLSADDDTGYVYISYRLNTILRDVGEMKREYSAIPANFMLGNDHLKKLMNSKEYKQHFLSDRMNGGYGPTGVSIDFMNYDDEDYSEIQLTRSELQSFISALDKDFMERSWEDTLSGIRRSEVKEQLGGYFDYDDLSMGTITVYSEKDTYKDVNGNEVRTYGSGYYVEYSETLLPDMTNTLEWLRSHGYGKYLSEQ